MVNCHCSLCREWSGEDYSPLSIFWRVAVQAKGPIEYDKKTTALLGLIGANRSHCGKCKDKHICFFGSRTFVALAFISPRALTRVISDDGDASKLKPSVNTYYNSGLKKGEMGVPLTLYSDSGTRLYAIWSIVLKALPQLVGFLLWSLWNGMVSKMKRE